MSPSKLFAISAAIAILDVTDILVEYYSCSPLTIRPTTECSSHTDVENSGEARVYDAHVVRPRSADTCCCAILATLTLSSITSSISVSYVHVISGGLSL